MKIELHEILVKDLAQGYIDNHEEGVSGYGGRLNIRPPSAGEPDLKISAEIVRVNPALRLFASM